MIVVDTSALAKLLVAEEESGALRRFLAQRSTDGEEFAISTIAVTELRRLAIRIDVPLEAIEPIVSRFRVLRINEAMLQLAGRLPVRHLGTLDAIHIATALAAEATALVTYDLRQADAAEREGLRPFSPKDAGDHGD